MTATPHPDVARDRRAIERVLSRLTLAASALNRGDHHSLSQQLRLAADEASELAARGVTQKARVRFVIEADEAILSQREAGAA